MDVQGAFLAKVILHADMRAAVNARISTDHFTDERYQRVYGYLLRHWKEYGTSPDLSVVTTAFPTMTWEDHPQPLDYFIKALMQRRKTSVVMEGLSNASLMLKSSDNPDAIDEVESLLHDVLLRAALEANRTYDIDLAQSTDEIWELLEERKANPGYLRGISTGFAGIDFVTGGLQAEHFVVLLGTPKSFKSSTALAMALRIHAQGKVCLFVGFEMSNVEQTDRSVSLLSAVSLTNIMNGSFTTQEGDRILDALEELEKMGPLIFSSDITSGMTVSSIQAKIQELNPDVVIVDGAYLMQSELPGVEPGSPQAITSISRGLKRLAQHQKIPIVVTTQASQTRSQGGLHMGSAMYSQAWAQDCDILLGVERVRPHGKRQTPEDDDTADFGPVQTRFKVIESRSGPRKTVILEWDWNEGSVEELDPQAQTQILRSNGGGAQFIRDVDELED